MQKILIAVVAVLLLTTALFLGPQIISNLGGGNSQPSEYYEAIERTDQLSRDERWHEDLDYLYKYLQERHPNPFYRTDKSRLDQAVERLHEQIPEMSDARVMLELQRIVALVKDGHTSLHLDPEMTGFRMIPVRLYWFSDGMYIIDALEPYADTIGSKIYQIDNTLLEEAYIRLNAYVSAENNVWPQLVVPYRLRSPEILEAFGYVESAESSTWRLVTTNDDFYTVEVSPIEYDDAPESFFQGAPLIDRSPEAPLYLQDTTEDFWLEVLDDQNILFAQYNGVTSRTQSGEAISQFANRIGQIADQHDGIKIVVDMRHNGGGDNTTYGPLLNQLTQNEKINQEGKLFVIIGRNTFSAAVNFVAELEQNSNAIFLGEPTGNSPNQYGDCEFLTLPHSGLNACISTIYWVKSAPDDTRTSIMPDHEIPLTYLNYARHEDPVLNAIMQFWE